ncbi:MAG: class F sortase [Actinomycetia bacterium]|nr:class F sortase [Actinomycetes bacterium]
MGKHSAARRPVGLWVPVLVVGAGLIIALTNWLGLLSGDPEPGEDRIPDSIAVQAASAESATETATETQTPSEETAEEVTEETTEESTDATEDATAAGPPVVNSVLRPAGNPSRVEVHAASGQRLVDASLQGARLDSRGVLSPPGGVAGWYAEPGWAKPGWEGASIIAAHVRSGGRPDVFWHIPQAVPGDVITVTYDSGQQSQFRITRSTAMDKHDVPKDDSIWDHASPTPKLALITCDPATPARSNGHREGNWVVWAVPVA